MRPVLIIHFSKRRSILSHGQKVCSLHMCPRGALVSVCVVAEGARLVTGSDVCSSNATKWRVCPILSAQPVSE